jgi:polyribonucleotide nucleotidyltransferase
MAKQAGGSAFLVFGETAVLATATAQTSTREGIDFFPLTCDYQEKTFAAGKIPGGFFKREGRPAEKEILSSRLIDRPIRPLFPSGFNCETQVIATVLSHDKENDPDVVSIVGASTALVLSDIPFNGPIAAVRIGRLDGKFVINPTQSQVPSLDLNIVVAGSRDAIVMVEGGAQMQPEAVVLEALFAAHDAMQPLIEMQEKLRGLAGKPKRLVMQVPVDAALEARVKEIGLPKLKAALQKTAKHERYDALDAAKDEVVGAFATEARIASKTSPRPSRSSRSTSVREAILEGRPPARRPRLADVRPISCEVEILPRTHGSALFTRGETQALVVADARDVIRRAEDRRADRRALQALHAALQLPALQHGRGEVPPQPRPARDRPRRARRASARTDHPRRRRSSPTRARRLRGPRVERLLLDGHRVRRLAVADGRGRADQGARRRRRHGTHPRGRRGPRPVGHPG